MVWALAVTETVGYGVLFYSFAVFVVPMRAGEWRDVRGEVEVEGRFPGLVLVLRKDRSSGAADKGRVETGQAGPSAPAEGE